MTTVKVLTLGPGALDRNAALAMGLLPARFGFPDFPLPALRTLILSDVPRNVVRRIVLQRMSVAGSLEELFYREKEDKRVPNDWQYQAKKYHRIGKMIYPSQSSRGVPAGSRAKDNPWPSVDASGQNLSLAVTSIVWSRILHKKYPQCAARREHVVEMHS
ncbi:hypothetical protein K503DRAFT_226014 [Rhizopogon vinicolor AM-OR11-026]|uniref:Uncharacterized protein n=1 Tax=Rhizopogon vinicolor AM-OR11-026 TaxID=1314800 RepID=A0A1B7MY99_9AGAM|nr:hypothetical protein K503DRAFT_226014 [Rhizopogon vinicolor AM-OR11-026]